MEGVELILSGSWPAKKCPLGALDPLFTGNEGTLIARKTTYKAFYRQKLAIPDGDGTR